MLKKLFPFEIIRSGQKNMMEFILENLNQGVISFIHAPTGIGKTVASLVPTLVYSLSNDYKIFFLSNRHEHHRSVFDTVQKINRKSGFNITTINLINKRFLCNYDIDKITVNDFYDFCKKMRQKKSCIFYNNTIINNKLSHRARIYIENLLNSDYKFNVWNIKQEVKDFCPYEIFLEIAKKSNVIILDYYYMFNPGIASALLGKLNIDRENIILVIDEAHNLPERIRRMNSLKLSGYVFSRAVNEVYEYDEYLAKDLRDMLLNITMKIKNLIKKPGESYVDANFLSDVIEKYYGYDALVDALYEVAEKVYLQKRTSYANAMKRFLEWWKFNTEHIKRIATLKEKDKWELQVFDVDVAHKASEVLRNVAGSVLMSATLLPINMYKEILGVNDISRSLILSSPFPKTNAYVRAVLGLTTKYEYRNEEMFKRYARFLEKIAKATSHNILVFYPSYEIMEMILAFISVRGKKMLVERKDITSYEKEDYLFMLKEYKNVMLHAVVGANFYEGVDFKGDMVNVVIVIGLPFERPDLYNQAIIDYYDKMFGKGKEYGYIIPSINKTLQSAGRCIRGENEKGVILFVDDRYRYYNYISLIKQHYDLKYVYEESADRLAEEIAAFLGNK